MEIKIVVATHKKAAMPADDMYLPLQVGAAGSPGLGLRRDDVGENISDKNKDYCELTGLYWAWKNLDYEYLGLVHYRRYFSRNRRSFSEKKSWSQIAGRSDIEKLLCMAPVILPKKRNYYIESIYSQYAHAHSKKELDMAGEIIKEKYPECAKYFDSLKNKKSAHMFNMFVMRKDYFDDYCRWLFDILFSLEERLQGRYEPRMFGFISERLLDVWLESRKVPYLEQSIVAFGVDNVFIKGARLVGRKIKAGLGV
ncbi:DUF4422 domain-containing protein [Anaerovibrio slackiae]|uniref:DUF4422 domain-containing protein n=1 Tax=Anaerovibrio slackiae TaxID=2652309 RepID=UPI003864C137